MTLLISPGGLQVNTDSSWRVLCFRLAGGTCPADGLIFCLVVLFYEAVVSKCILHFGRCDKQANTWTLKRHGAQRASQTWSCFSWCVQWLPGVIPLSPCWSGKLQLSPSRSNLGISKTYFAWTCLLVRLKPLTLQANLLVRVIHRVESSATVSRRRRTFCVSCKSNRLPASGIYSRKSKCM